MPEAVSPPDLPMIGSMSEIQFAAIAEMVTGRRGRLRVYLFEVFTALAFPLLGVQYLISPEAFAVHSAIGHTVFPFDYVWNAGYILGGLLVLYGIIRPSMPWRTAGLILLGTALALQCAAALVEAPQLRDLFNGLYAVACFTRAYLLVMLFRRYQGVMTAVSGARAAVR